MADGAYDSTFPLYDVETGGVLLRSEAQGRVAVRKGVFSALFGSVDAIPMDALDGGERWLAVSVRGPGESDFTAFLSPPLLWRVCCCWPASCWPNRAAVLIRPPGIVASKEQPPAGAIA